VFIIIICKKVIFYGEEFLAPCPNPKLEDHNIKMDLREIGLDSMDWIGLAEDRD
jgi:hypothetical protein